jgi:hypothetical protein
MLEGCLFRLRGFNSVGHESILVARAEGGKFPAPTGAARSL